MTAGKARRLAKPYAFLFTVSTPSRKRAFVSMILTCPNCGTQYVVKDGAIPPEGRQVRCAACKHSWHQEPEGGAASATMDEPASVEDAQPAAEPAPEAQPSEAGEDESYAEAALIDPRSGPEA